MKYRHSRSCCIDRSKHPQLCITSWVVASDQHTAERLVVRGFLGFVIVEIPAKEVRMKWLRLSKKSYLNAMRTIDKKYDCLKIFPFSDQRSAMSLLLSIMQRRRKTQTCSWSSRITIICKITPMSTVESITFGWTWATAAYEVKREKVRKSITTINCEVLFTRGTTTGLNWVACLRRRSLMRWWSPIYKYHFQSSFLGSNRKKTGANCLVSI